jgi:hypothetical protein
VGGGPAISVGRQAEEPMANSSKINTKQCLQSIALSFGRFNELSICISFWQDF